jgi:hypothetical protein
VKNNSLLSNGKKYRPNLVDLMKLCERNYFLLCQLLLNKKTGETENIGDQHHFFISEQLTYSIVVKEVTRYTTLIHIAQNQSVTNTDVHHKITQLLSPTMIIRLYHDARMAEVNSSQHIRWLKPRYDYPNEKMHLPDEKQQVNQFLKEWLQLCLQQGQVNVPFIDNDLAGNN